MKFQIPAKEFANAIAAAGKVIESRNNIPILSNIAIEARDDSIVLRSTDLDIEYSIAVAASVIEPGATTIPAKLSGDISKKVSGDVTFALSEGAQQATLSAGRSRFQLMTLPVSDYPTLTAGEFPHSFTLTGDSLHSALSSVEFAISTEETRYYLNGVFMHFHADGTPDGKMRFVATDGHRLARMEITAPSRSEGMSGVIIPRKTVKEAVSIASAAKGGDVRIDVSDTKIRFTSGDTVLTSKIIDGTFPDYQRVIPTDGNIFARVDSKSLIAAADRVSTISTERGRAVKLGFTAGSLSLQASSPDAGSAEDVIDVDFDADDMEIGLNAKYAATALSTIGDGNIRMQLKDAGSPVLLRREDNDNLLIVIMPMRV